MNKLTIAIAAAAVVCAFPAAAANTNLDVRANVKATCVIDQVTSIDFGETNGFFYLLMEFVDGVNLRELLRLKRLSPEEALAIVPLLCHALASMYRC